MRTLTLLFICLIFNSVSAIGQIDTIRYFESYFETSADQLQWTSLPPDNVKKWTFQKGGNMLNPDTAYSGNTNAFLYWSDFVPVIRNLVSDPIDLSDAKKPLLTFGHAMAQSWSNTDQMALLFKAGSSAPWDTIMRYLTYENQWILRSINIAEKYLVDGFQVAFKGTARGGHGICIDQVVIEEKDIINRYVKTLNLRNVNHKLIPSGASDIPVTRMDIKIVGNVGTMNLNSIKFISQSAHDSLFATNGFELVATQDSIYQPTMDGTSLKIGSAVSISNGTITFTDLNYTLNTGYNAIWLVADVKSTAPHNSIVDFKIEANEIDISGQKFPGTTLLTSGSNNIEQSVFYDSFEEATLWTLEPDFETAVPQGFSFTTSDPYFAYSGLKVLGTDLTTDGWYKLNVSGAGDYYATTPVFNLQYYDNVKLSFEKWFAFEGSDQGVIEVSVDTAKTWQRIWDSRDDALSPENEWSKLVFDEEFDNIAARQPWVKVRFGITFSNNVFAYAGFNVDNFAITGNYLTNDVGITEILKPVGDCFNPGLDIVQLVVCNYADRPTASTIPVFFSIDGTVANKVYETIPGPIASGDSVIFQFSSAANFPGPGNYSGFKVGLEASGDEDADNNILNRAIYIQESLSPPDHQNFEVGEGYWRMYGSDPTWVCQPPDGSIPPIPGSPTAWILSTFGNYLTNDTSYLESSCYDLASAPRSVFEMKLWLDSEEGKDGALVEYSKDDGANWSILSDNEYSWNWNWYNGNVFALGASGWSGISDGNWKTVRQLLPAALGTEPKVKFRVKWASDNNNTFRGMAVDEVKIYPLPHDIGVSKIDSFADRCQFINPDLVTVNIKNLGISTMKQNDSIIVGFDLNEERIAIDTFKLSADLLPGGTIKHSFSVPVDISEPGSYNITAYTLLEDDPWFYFGNNDTTSVDFEVLPNPFTFLPDTIQTRMPDTVLITSFYHDDYDYLWQDLINTTNVYDVENAGWYYITVTAERGNGCTAYDSSYVELLFNDVGIDSLLYPVDHCGLTTQEYLNVRVKNFGTDSIASGQKIAVAYKLNNGSLVTDTLKLVNVLHSGHTVNFSFTKGPANLKNKGTYSFKIFTAYSGDTIAINDTIISVVEIIGRPEVDLGPDKTVQALSYTLDAGNSFESYYWDNGITAQTREVNETGTFWVRVYDENQCDNYDTVYVRLKIRDISPVGFTSPVSDCRLDPDEPVVLRILNTGTDTVPAGSAITVSYRLGENTRVSEDIILSAAVFPGAYTDHAFPGTINLSDPADYNLEATTVTAGDLRTGNDTSFVTVYRYPKPIVDFGLENTEYIEDISLLLEAGYSPEYTYHWQDGSTEHQYTVTSDGTFHVIATDTRTACFDRDTVKVYLIYDDVGVTWSGMPLNGCTGEYKDIQVRVKNLGTSNIGKDVPIYIACDVDDVRITIDTLVRNGNFGIGASLDLTLTGNVKISSGGTSTVAFYTLYGSDMKSYNDTLRLSFTALASPVLDFGDVNGELVVDLPYTLDAGSGHKSYLWQDGAITQTYQVIEKGTYSVSVIGENDCQATKTVRINMADGFFETEGDPGDIIVYPNPNNGLFTISVDPDADAEAVIRIVNNQGQIVYAKELEIFESDKAEIDVQHLQSGIYHLLIITEKQTYQGKLILQ